MKCCNHVFTAKDIKPPLLNKQQALGTNEKHLLGGRAERFSKTKCPECDKEHILWLKGEHNTYTVLHVTPVEKPQEEETVFYCEECDKHFKSEQGLKSHNGKVHAQTA